MKTIPALAPGKLVLLYAPEKDAMLKIAARVALAGPVHILDIGNQFDAYYVARLIRRQVEGVDKVLSQIQVARAFTCFQAVALFEQVAFTDRPTLVLDLLATFYDDSVSLNESQRLLQIVLGHLKRLCQTAPVVLSLYPPRLAERAYLVQMVMDLADQVFTWEEASTAAPARLL